MWLSLIAEMSVPTSLLISSFREGRASAVDQLPLSSAQKTSKVEELASIIISFLHRSVQFYLINILSLLGSRLDRE